MSYIKIDGDEKTERNINYSIFHSTALLQESGNENNFSTMGKSADFECKDLKCCDLL